MITTSPDRPPATPPPAVPLDAIRQAAILYDAHGRIVAANDRAEALAGRPLSALTGADALGVFRHTRPDGTPLAPAELPSARALAGDEAIEEPLVITTSDGRSVDVLATASPIRDGDAITGALVVWQDITERRRTEQALLASEQRFRLALRNAPVSVSVMDRELRYVWAYNQRTAPPGGIVGLTDAELFTPEEAAYLTAIKERVLAEGVEVREQLWLDRPGGPIYLDCYFEPVRDDDGRIAGVGIATVDLTRRELAEAALHASQEELRRASQGMAAERDRVRNLLEIAGVMILALDAKGRVTLINRRGSEILGYPEEEILGRDWAETFLPEGIRAELRDAFARVLAGELEDMGHHENPVLTRGGEERHILWSNRLIVDDAGMVVGVLSSGEDITERERISEALRASEARYRGLFEAMTEGVNLVEPIFDDQGVPVSYRYLDANPALERLTHLTRDGIIGRDVRDVLPNVEPYWIETFGRVAFTGEPARIEAYSQDLAGWFDVTVYSPAPGQAALIFSNITERKRVEDALRDSERRYRMLHESLRDAFVEVSMDGRIIDCNDLYCEMLGYSQDEVRRLTYQELTPERWNAMEDGIVRTQIIARGYSDVYEKEYRRKDGTIIPVELRTILSRDDAGSPVAMWGIVREIAERKQAEQRLAHYARQLEASNEELQRFAYVASHDLQEPLRSIVSFSQLLERRYRGKLDTDADEYINFIVEGGNRMQRLIRDLLQVSRIETAARPLKPTDADEVVAGVVRSLEIPLREADATVTLGPLPTVMADKAQLEQVFANLVSNAIKYRSPDRPPEIGITARRLNGMVEFSVTDNGIGIEAEYFDRIFEMFRRLHTHDKYEGTGIGLAVVKRIVERHGGTVRVESTPGEGSTFFFTLPAA